MLEEILKLAKEMISIKSTADDPEELKKILDLALLNLKGYTIERFNKDGAESVLIYNSKKRPEKFKLLLNGHLDVIPGKESQYFPKIVGNRLYGVGSMDMKANAACLILAFKEIATKVSYPLGLQLVTDEEIGGFNGTKYQIDQGVNAEFVLAGEPTNFNIVNKAKGVIWLKISSKGKSAHGAYLKNGKNAIWKMNKFLNLLEKSFPASSLDEWVTTINLSSIETANKAFNKIPDNCTICLDIRYVPEEENTVISKIKKLLPVGFSIEVLVKEPALYTPENDRFVSLLQDITKRTIKKSPICYGAHGTSDARHFTQIGSAGVEFGPIGGGIGSDKEWVDIKSLEKYLKIIKNLILEI